MDGEDVPNLTSSLPALKLYSAALVQPMPQDSRYLPFWTSPNQFRKALFGLLAHFGREDPTVAVKKDDAGQDGMRHWLLDVDSMSKATGIDWPHWDRWIARIERNLGRMRQYCEAQSIVPPDWYQLFWQTGNAVRQTIGYRLRILEDLEGRVMWDDFVQALECYPSRLAQADTLAQRLSVSNLLSELLAAEFVTPSGVIVWLDLFRRDTYPLMRFLGMQPGSVSFIFPS